MPELSYLEYLPTPSLAPFIRRVWRLTAPVGAIGDAQPIVPDGCVELIFHLGDRFRRLEDREWVTQPRAILVGAVTGPTVVEPSGVADVVGIRLQPWSGRAFLGFPLSEIRGELVQLDEVTPALCSRLLPALEDAPDETRRLATLFDALEAHVTRQAAPDAALRAAVECLTTSQTLPSIADLASSLGRSTRWLQRAFSETLGFGPKMLARITRVQRALRLARIDERASWAAIAADAGYFDHSHLVRDFKQLVGCTPSEFDRRQMPITDAFVEA